MARSLFLFTLLTLGAGCGPESTGPGNPEQELGTAGEALGEGPAFLIKDIKTNTPVNGSSQPKLFVALEGALYFAATDSTSGEELWKTDGTSAGTVMVSDLCSGPCSSSPRSLTAMNGALYFFASDSSGNLGLWRSDGTAAGTKMLKGIDINNFGPKLTPINGTLYFGVYDPTLGNELWTSDGTVDGTKMLKDINPGSASSSPSSFIAFNGTVFFSATSAAGSELWTTDGTAAGTVMFKDILPGTNGSFPAGFVVNNGMLYFLATDAPNLRGLFRSDGTAAGTVKVKEFGNMGNPVLFNGLMYFWASDATYGQELWKSDGTTAGTVLAVDVNAGSSGSNMGNPLVVGNNLVFTAYSVTGGTALWKSDGTQAGTQRIITAPRYMGNLNAVGSSLYFTAQETSTASSLYTELWVSDLTAAGTYVVKDINPGTSAGGFSTSATSYFGALNGVLYFGANDGSSGYELWRSDGTATGTTRVRDLYGSVSESSPANLLVASGLVYFTADDGSYGVEPWRSDGTATGTYRYWDVCSGTCSPILSSFTPHGGNMFYINASNGIGSSGPARLMRSPTAPYGGSGALYVDTSLTVTSPRLVSYKNWLYFRATDTAYGDTLRMTDGSYTTRVNDTTGRGLKTPDQMVVSNGMLFFSADDGTGLGTELYKTDGTYSGSSRVMDIWPGANGSYPSNLTDVNGTLFFRAQDGTGSYTQLWKSDGTSAGTVKVATLFPGTNGVLSNFNNVSGTLFFFVNDNTSVALWKSDGTSAGTVKVKDLPAGAAVGSSSFATMGGALYFGLRDDAHGYELWKSDGTPEGTDVLVDIRPGPNGGLGQSYNNGALVTNLLPLAEGLMLFSASDGETGMELWMTDGTAAGTVRLTDVAPGNASSTPTTLVRVGNLVYFAANDGVRGRELWALRVADLLDRTPPTVSCPAGVVAEATSPAGASVTYPAATATDDRTASPSLTYSKASGTVFPLGVTPVTVTARDSVGNSATCAFTVTVRDTVAPVVSCPADVVAEATSPSGASVTYPVATATDAATASPSITYSMEPGAVFPFGSTSVTATATDAAGNSAACAFSVTVRDTTGPVLQCRADVTVWTTSEEGAQVDYMPAPAKDAVSRATVSYDKPSGGFFPVGRSTVTVTATDVLGNTSSCDFRVDVIQDLEPPELTCPAEMTWRASSCEGTLMSELPVSATDVLSPVFVSHREPLDALLPVGDRVLTVTAVDAAGNSAGCDILVHIVAPEGCAEEGALLAR